MCVGPTFGMDHRTTKTSGTLLQPNLNACLLGTQVQMHRNNAQLCESGTGNGARENFAENGGMKDGNF